MTEKLLHLSFTAQQLDYIANVLGQRPWVEVAPIITNIQQQLAAQQQGPTPLSNGQDPIAAPS